MVVLVMSTQVKPNADAAFAEQFENQMLPFLRAQRGFKDEMALFTPGGPEIVLATFLGVRRGRPELRAHRLARIDEEAVTHPVCGTGRFTNLPWRNAETGISGSNRGPRCSALRRGYRAAARGVHAYGLHALRPRTTPAHPHLERHPDPRSRSEGFRRCSTYRDGTPVNSYSLAA